MSAQITDWTVVSSKGTGEAVDTKRDRVDTVLLNLDGPVLDRLTLERYYKFPQYFSYHQDDDSVMFLKYNWKQREGSIQEVDLYYSNQIPEQKMPGGQNPFQYIENPLARPAMISRGTWVNVEIPEKDANGVRVETTAGEPIPWQVEYHYTNFVVTKHISQPFSIGIAALKERKDTIRDLSLKLANGDYAIAKVSENLYPSAYDSIDFINTDYVTMKNVRYAPTTLWATNFTESEYQVEGKYVFYTLQFEIRHKPSGWWRRTLNAGYIMNKAEYPPGFVGPLSEDQWDAAKKTPERIKVGDPPGYPRHPVPLDEKGRPFTNSDGDIITSSASGLDPKKLIYRLFMPYQPLDFTNNFPNLNGVGIFK